jgi:ATP-dependent protease HslVU (ClpYQ) ATPase subunit
VLEQQFVVSMLLTSPSTKVDTSKMLFIASGAFHAVKVKDILPELQVCIG